MNAEPFPGPARATAAPPRALSGREARPVHEHEGGRSLRASQAQQEVEDFTSDAAHQLRTPLARILGELGLVLANAGPLSGEVRARLESVRSEVEAHLQTCTRLLLLAQLDGGVLDREQRSDEVDLAAVMRELIELMTPLANEKAIRVHLLGLGARGRLVRCCKALLIEALFNLLDNAIRYTPGGGRVDVAVLTRERYVVVSVSDTGPGVPAQERRLIFRRFYRGTLGAGEAGTGLGLAIARAIARAHGGDVLLSSPTGRGATFEVRLPAV